MPCPVARQAHNLKVVSSNLAPATSFISDTNHLSRGPEPSDPRLYQHVLNTVGAGEFNPGILIDYQPSFRLNQHWLLVRARAPGYGRRERASSGPITGKCSMENHVILGGDVQLFKRPNSKFWYCEAPVSAFLAYSCRLIVRGS